MYIYAGIISALLLQAGFATEAVPQNLDELLSKVKGLPKVAEVPTVMERIKEHNPTLMQAICKEVLAPDFYDKASKAEVGTIKNRAMVTYCSGTTFERADLKKLTQKEKQAATGPETVQLKKSEQAAAKSPESSSPVLSKVQLRHVEFHRGQNYEQDRDNLKKDEEAIIENMKMLESQKEFDAKKKQELETKLQQASHNLKEAQDFYDNLSAAIIGMREDLKSPGVINQLRLFKPAEHEHDTPEKYLNAAKDDLPKENIKGFDMALQRTFPGFLDQLPIAESLLQQANQHLAEARRDLEAINRELLSLVVNK